MTQLSLCRTCGRLLNMHDDQDHEPNVVVWRDDDTPNAQPDDTEWLDSVRAALLRLLGDADFVAWVERESGGYQGRREPPEDTAELVLTDLAEVDDVQEAISLLRTQYDEPSWF